jgi:hypothetical protein
VLVVGVVLLGGLVQGVAGFGNAVVSTALLATVLDPAAAVVVPILPVLAANLALVRELDRETLSACLRRFRPYLAAALVGTLAGMALLERLPSAVLALGLGLLTGLYVLGRQPYVTVPGEARLRAVCFRPGTAAKVGLGAVSGLVFGASNIAVQVVAYLDALELDRSTFVGVLGMVLVGIASVRVLAALGFGLYGDGTRLALSAVAVVPGVAGVVVGSRLRPLVPERLQVAGTVLLLSVIAVRLTVAGAGGL